MNYVMTQGMKAKFLQIRIREDIKKDLQIAAELKGLSVSGLLHSLIVKTIREEKEISPQSFQFAPKLEKPSLQTRAEIERDYELKQAEVVPIKQKLPEGFGLIGYDGSTESDIDKISRNMQKKRKKTG